MRKKGAPRKNAGTPVRKKTFNSIARSTNAGRACIQPAPEAHTRAYAEMCGDGKMAYERVCRAHDYEKMLRISNPVSALRLEHRGSFTAFKYGTRIYKGVRPFMIERLVGPIHPSSLAANGTNHRSGMTMGKTVGVELAKWAQQRIPPGGKAPVRTRFAKYFIQNAIMEWKWFPIDGETPVKSDALGVATGVDLTLWDAINKRVVVVEIKCGMNGTWDTPVGRPARATGEPNTMHTHAKIQAAMTGHLYFTHFGISPISVYLVRISNSSSGPGAGVSIERECVPSVYIRTVLSKCS